MDFCELYNIHISNYPACRRTYDNVVPPIFCDTCQPFLISGAHRNDANLKQNLRMWRPSPRKRSMCSLFWQLRTVTKWGRPLSGEGEIPGLPEGPSRGRGFHSVTPPCGEEEACPPMHSLPLSPPKDLVSKCKKSLRSLHRQIRAHLSRCVCVEVQTAARAAFIRES